MPANEKVPSPGKERTKSSDKLADKKNRRLLKAIVSVVTAAVTAVVCDYFVQGSHSLAAPAVCGVKYLTAPPSSYPDSSHWVAYGVSNLTTTSSRSFSLQPGGQLLTDEWFGATLAGPDLCDYRVAFDADITGPLHPAAVRILGYGYAVGARAEAVNDVPQGTTVQFDPPFGGLRTVVLPDDANSPSHNPEQFSFVNTGHYHHWVLTVRGEDMTVSVDGQRYPHVVHLDGAGPGGILFRIWNARLDVRDVKISKLRP